MEEYKADFLAFAIESGALTFGEFTLKSGRVSPYFFNTGAFSSGASLAKLARAYSMCIDKKNLEFDMLFGPAYKGIPLVSTISVCYSSLYDRDIGFCFNRKEEKKHGEKGAIVGQKLKGNVLIIDDVISAGTSVRESVKIIEGKSACPVAVVITLDRQERGLGSETAVEEAERSLNLKVESIVSFKDIVRYLQNIGNFSSEIEALQEYHIAYGNKVSE
tara:strand:- start:2144 stop:2797 length:654 start_codon:yes stop_codon:yes gene_type:complete